MKVKVEKKFNIPTREQIVSYLKGQGYPMPDEWAIEDFVLPDNYERRFQYWEAVAENIDMCDFERWQHFEDVIGCLIDWESFRIIHGVFYKNDIDILEMPIDKR